MQCELCGREAALVATRVAGTVLHACSACTGSGRKATAREAMGQVAWVTQSLAKRAHRQQVNDEAPGDMLVTDCGARVRKARQQRGWDHTQLAQKAAEKKSIIASVEAGHHHPAEKLVRKLERLLGIRLTEDAEGQGPASAGGRKAEALTMGDLLKQALDEG